MRKKVAILLLSFERADILAQTLKKNIENAGCLVDVIALDQGSADPRVMDILQQHCKEVHVASKNIGIGAAMNYLLKRAMDMGYYYFQFMANDIQEGYGWVSAKVLAIQNLPEEFAGMVSIYPGVGDIPYPVSPWPGVYGHAGHVIGQFMISRDVVDEVGFFNTFGQPYAPIDNDYNVRCERMGFVNFYLTDRRAAHLDILDDIYGYDKAAKIQQTWPQHVADSCRYNKENSYLSYEEGEYTINMVEM